MTTCFRPYSSPHFLILYCNVVRLKPTCTAACRARKKWIASDDFDPNQILPRWQ